MTLSSSYVQMPIRTHSRQQSSINGTESRNPLEGLPTRDLYAAGEIARRLGMSKRTLARRVSSEGLTFAGILADLRVDLARRHLTDEDLAISQIAWLLGYQEVSAFTHAFKRQTGKAPSEVRLKRAVS